MHAVLINQIADILHFNDKKQIKSDITLLTIYGRKNCIRSHHFELALNNPYNFQGALKTKR